MATVVRVTIAYILLMLAFRVLGKRELRKMSAFELVTLLLIPQMFSRALTRQDYSFTNAVIGASTIIALVWIMSAIIYRWGRAGRIIKGEPAVLVADGDFVPDAMDRERVSVNDLYAEFHRAGLERVADVRWAILETSGTITVVPRDPARRSAGGSPEDDEVP